MKKTVYILFLILLSSKGLAQQNNAVNIKSISNNFNKLQVSAYQNSSLEKFDQFVEYFNLMQKTDDLDLKNQLKESIFILFQSTETEFSDFLSNNEKIKLNQFISKYQNSKDILEVISQESNKSVLQNSWVNSYQIKINSGKTIALEQLISFQIQEKKFGKNSKEVWEIKLGNLSIKQ
ncbi:MAG: hypothetical protein DI529_14345 [Chryseobacterium sp.]|nr:MAG: hypothetical protein DI529_14345 [Chryseobacterium sp.]